MKFTDWEARSKRMRHWQVCGSMPPVDRPGYSRGYCQNINAHVVTLTALRAMELTEEKHPGITIHSINHRGDIEIIEDRSQ